MLTPETRLLFLTTRPSPADGDEIAAMVANGLDWQEVARFAAQERLLPVMWNRMAPYAAGVPAPEAEAFQRLTGLSEFRMSLREDSLLRVARELDEAGFRCMLLKGAALATTVYGSFLHRPMGDLDILLPPGSAEHAWQLLRELGWGLEYEETGHFYDDAHHLSPLLDPHGTELVLEVHRSLFPKASPFVLDPDSLWAEARPVRVGTVDLWVMSPRWQLLHLCLHFAWGGVLSRGIGRAVRDVATLLDADPPVWSEFVELVKEARGDTGCYWTLRLARDLSGAKVPDEVLEALHPGLPEPVLSALARSFVTSSVGIPETAAPIRLQQFMWTLGTRPRRSAHGKHRPWALAELWQDEVSEAETPLQDQASDSGPFARVASLAGFLGKALWPQDLM